MWKVIADSIQLVVPTYRSARTAKVGTLTITRRRYLPHMSLSVFLSAPIHRSSSMSRFALGSSLGATKRHEEPRKADVNNLSPRECAQMVGLQSSPGSGPRRDSRCEAEARPVLPPQGSIPCDGHES